MVFKLKLNPIYLKDYPNKSKVNYLIYNSNTLILAPINSRLNYNLAQQFSNKKFHITHNNNSTSSSNSNPINQTQTQTQIQKQNQIQDQIGSSKKETNENGNRNAFPFTILPNFIHPYIELGRYHRPIGTWLLLFPTLWSSALANLVYGTQILPIELFFLFSIGALVMRGAGCTINDYWDRNFDKNVERTRMRPLASGEVSPNQALGFMIFQSLIGAAVLFQLNPFTIWTGIASLGFVAIYPLMKRITNWPQLFLGITFNWGVWVGWAAVTGSLNLPVLIPFYISCIAWTLIYDTIYAHQDKEDDIKIGVKSTALYFGEKTKQILSIFLLIFISGMIISGYNIQKLLFEKFSQNQTQIQTQIQTQTQDNKTHSTYKSSNFSTNKSSNFSTNNYSNNKDKSIEIETIYNNTLKIMLPYYLSIGLASIHLFNQIHFTDFNNTLQCNKIFKSNRQIGILLIIGILITSVQKERINEPILKK